MKKEITRNDKIIERLMEISNCIKIIYDKLITIDKDSEEYKKYQEYLKMAIEIEDSIYKNLGSEIYENHFINRFNYLTTRSEIKEKEAIYERYIGYVQMMYYLNPFHSTIPNLEEREEEDSVFIKNQACMDYLKATYHELETKINTTKKKSEKKLLNTALNNLLFKNKVIAILIKDNKFKNPDGRKRCKAFLHSEENITYYYQIYAFSYINNAIINILNFNNVLFEEISMRAALKLLTKEEIFQVSKDYYTATTTDNYYKNLIINNNNHELILSIIKEELEKKSKETKPKRKTKQKNSQ